MEGHFFALYENGKEQLVECLYWTSQEGQPVSCACRELPARAARLNLAQLMEMIIVQIIVKGVKHLMVSDTRVTKDNWSSDVIGKIMMFQRRRLEICLEEIVRYNLSY